VSRRDLLSGDAASRRAHRGEVVVTDKGGASITLFPAEELPIANRIGERLWQQIALCLALVLCTVPALTEQNRKQRGTLAQRIGARRRIPPMRSSDPENPPHHSRPQGERRNLNPDADACARAGYGERAPPLHPVADAAGLVQKGDNRSSTTAEIIRGRSR